MSWPASTSDMHNEFWPTLQKFHSSKILDPPKHYVMDLEVVSSTLHRNVTLRNESLSTHSRDFGLNDCC
jgi:hypothetical protein